MQPGTGCVRSGSSPSSLIRRRSRSSAGLGIGTAESSAIVYGCCGALKISSASATSTNCPPYITATRSQTCRTVERSCEMKR